MAKVLILDDSPGLLEVLSLVLKKKYEVETALSKRYLDQKLPLFVPDIILLDVKLNGGDGRELCKYIKTKTPHKHIPVLLLLAGLNLLDGYEECEAADIIEKPFHIKTIFQKIDLQLTILQS